MSAKHRLPKKDIFAISKSYFSHPLITDMRGVEYHKHYISKYPQSGWCIVTVEISKEDALALIDKYNMEVVIKGPQGMLWDTHPISLRNECLRLGLTYTHNSLCK